jgi:hypothetical protein
MPQAIDELKLYSIKNVEVFSVGKWNDTKITLDDLKDMVRSFEDLKNGWRPCLKLGHDQQQLVARASGLPAIGWVENLYLNGNKLMADFCDIPEKVYKLIQAKSYRKVSCEVYFNFEYKDQKYKAFLGAVALLGAEKPGVMDLNDILGQFQAWEQAEVFAKLEKQDTFEQYQVNFELKQEDGTMPTVEELQKKLDDQKAEFEAKLKAEKEANDKKYEAEKAKDKEIADLKEFKAKAEAEQIAAELKAKDAAREAFMTKLEGSKLVTPVTKKLIGQLINDKLEFSLKEGEKCTREEVVEKLLSLTVEAAKVNFDESSLADMNTDKSRNATKELDEKINKYAKENKVSYASAYKAVMKDESPEADEEE